MFITRECFRATAITDKCIRRPESAFILTWELFGESTTKSNLFPTTMMLKLRWVKLDRICSRIDRQYWNRVETKGIRAEFRDEMRVDLLEMFPNFPYRKQGRRLACFADPVDCCCDSIRRDCQLGTFSVRARARKKATGKESENT